MREAVAAALLALAFATPALAQHVHGRKHGNPTDLDGYIKRLSDPARDAWQKPDEVVAALGLKLGQTACDIGSGPGYFTLRLARAVGAAGFVFAVDVEPKILAALRDRLQPAAVRNVAPVLAVADDPLLPAAACDVVLIVDTYHHFPDRPAYLRRLQRVMKPGSRRATPVGPPLDHRIAREAFLEEARAAGFSLADEKTFLPHQYFLVLRAAPE
jgi:ubiquinone/menaquinone biosynthesis C-methylase UbiE